MGTPSELYLVPQQSLTRGEAGMWSHEKATSAVDEPCHIDDHRAPTRSSTGTASLPCDFRPPAYVCPTRVVIEESSALALPSKYIFMIKM